MRTSPHISPHYYHQIHHKNVKQSNNISQNLISINESQSVSLHQNKEQNYQNSHHIHVINSNQLPNNFTPSYFAHLPQPNLAIKLQPITQTSSNPYMLCECQMCKDYNNKRMLQILAHKTEQINNNKRQPKVSSQFMEVIKKLRLPTKYKIVKHGIDVFIPQICFYSQGQITGLFMNKDIQDIQIKKISKQNINPGLISKIFNDRRRQNKQYLKKIMQEKNTSKQGNYQALNKKNIHYRNHNSNSKKNDNEKQIQHEKNNNFEHQNGNNHNNNVTKQQHYYKVNKNNYSIYGQQHSINPQRLQELPMKSYLDNKQLHSLIQVYNKTQSNYLNSEIDLKNTKSSPPILTPPSPRFQTPNISSQKFAVRIKYKNSTQEQILTQTEFIMLNLKRKQDPIWKNIEIIKNNIIMTIDQTPKVFSVQYQPQKKEIKYENLYKRAKRLMRIYGGNIIQGQTKYISPQEQLLFCQQVIKNDPTIFCQYLIYKIVLFIETFYDTFVSKLYCKILINQINKPYLIDVINYKQTQTSTKLKFIWTNQSYKKMVDKQQKRIFLDKMINVTQEIQKKANSIQNVMENKYSQMKNKHGITLEQPDNQEEIKNNEFFKKIHPQFKNYLCQENKNLQLSQILLKQKNLTINMFRKKYLGQKQQKKPIIKQFHTHLIKMLHKTTPQFKAADYHEINDKPQDCGILSTRKQYKPRAFSAALSKSRSTRQDLLGLNVSQSHNMQSNGNNQSPNGKISKSNRIQYYNTQKNKINQTNCLNINISPSYNLQNSRKTQNSKIRSRSSQSKQSTPISTKRSSGCRLHMSPGQQNYAKQFLNIYK